MKSRGSARLRMVCETLQRGRTADLRSAARRQTGDRLITGAMLKDGHKSTKQASALTVESRFRILRPTGPQFLTLVTAPGR
jgi:hypothetical protein